MNQRHPRHEEGCSRGGKTQASKAYYCSTCDTVGQSNKFTWYHFEKGCNGQATQAGLISNRHNRHRLNEAIENTRMYNMEKLKPIYKDIKARMIADLESLRESAKQAMENLYNDPNRFSDQDLRDIASGKKKIF